MRRGMRWGEWGGMQYAVYGTMRDAVCSMQCGVCSMCSMRYAVCGMQYAVCGMQYAVCGMGTRYAQHTT